VFQEAETFGSKSGNGSWSGMIGLVSRGNAHVGAQAFVVTKERSEVVAYTDTLGFLR